MFKLLKAKVRRLLVLKGINIEIEKLETNKYVLLGFLYIINRYIDLTIRVLMLWVWTSFFYVKSVSKFWAVNVRKKKKNEFLKF